MIVFIMREFILLTLVNIYYSLLRHLYVLKAMIIRLFLIVKNIITYMCIIYEQIVHA